MKTIWKRGTGLFLTLVLLLSLCVPGVMAANITVDDAVAKSTQYMLNAVNDPQVGSVGGEWAVIGLARSGCKVPQSYWDNYYANVEKYVAERNGVLHKKKYTEYSRLIVALTAIGADPTNVAGYNLLTPLGDFDKTIWQGINGPIWALIALDTVGYEMPVNSQAKTKATRQMYVDEILSRQLNDGGWNLTDKGGNGASDPDITGMALQALANYRTQPNVQKAIDRAVSWLSNMQESNGGYSSWNNANSESVVQVIVALCSLGIDLNDSRFVKNGHTLLENLLSFQQADGSFIHMASNEGNNQMSSEQGLYGLVAVQRAQQGKNTLYAMSDVTGHAEAKPTEPEVPTNQNVTVQKVPVTMPGTTFSDIAGHKNQKAIEDMASRGIINGKGEGLFDPNATMTRAEFAAIVVRGLGLPEKTVQAFSDVAANQWFAPYIGTAYTCGIINGMGDGTFNPGGTITRQEAAVMVARAAKLCGMDTKMENSAIRDVLAQFSDYVTIAQWAQESVAFCYGKNIMDQSDLNVLPGQAILRCEVAQMLYNLLDAAKLL